MKKIKFGIFGLGRGSAFYNSIRVNDGEIVAICDMSEAKLAAAKEAIGTDVTAYTDFDEFLNHEGLEAVFLCNFFHEHAPYAIKALERNIHVLSECTSNGTMAEGVALVRAAEKSKAIYMLSENYPFMRFNQEMYRVYREGTLGRALFAEGEYNHPLDTADVEHIKKYRPFPTHWRNYTPRTYYITHSLAPLMYITGATPVRVTAMPVFAPDAPHDGLMGVNMADRSAIITCLNDDDSVFRVTGCAAYGAHGNSYRICCVKGQMENVRGTSTDVVLRYNKWDVPEGREATKFYTPEWPEEERANIEKAGHGGGDYFVIKEFFNCIREGRRPTFDHYFATTCASVAILAHRSVLARGVPYDIPDFRREEDREKYENDYLTPFYGSDGSEPTLPSCSHPDYVAPKEIQDYYNNIINS